MLGAAGINQIFGGVVALFGAMTLMAAGSSYQDYRADEAAKRAALAAGPPPAVALESFDPRRDAGPYGEVALLVAARPGAIERAPGPGTAWLLPLYADGAPEEEGPLGFAVHSLQTLVFAPSPGEDAAAFPDRQALIPGPSAPPVLGAPTIPLLLRGRMISPARHAPALSSWSRLVQQPLVIEAFAQPREAALAPDPNGFWRVLAFMAFGLAPLVYGIILLRAREI